MPTTKPDPRRSIYKRDNLLRLLASGRVPGRSDSIRIDRLAARYEILVSEALPKRLQLTAPEVLLLTELVTQLDIGNPDHVFMLPLKVGQAVGQGRALGADAEGLAYRLRNLRHSELLAVVDLAEVVLGRAARESRGPTREDAVAALDGVSGSTAGHP
ncbi:MAG: hypothetical protein BGO50_10520 [Rhodanobacter sp. 67-28]|nr:MAG: hypothetical protein BGO50_10520 [Rhodanobacter sp. 67-28]